MRNSELLRFKIQLASGELGAGLDRLWRHPEISQLFPSFLILLHQIIRASVPLMQAGRDAALQQLFDPVCTRLAPYLAEHIEEEMHHDIWTLEDLESVGFSKDAVLAKIPSPNVAALVGAQYYWIQHHHPVGLLGYITVLEGNPITPDELNELMIRTGLPESLFRTYKMHGELDPGHKAELDALLDSLPLTQSQAALVAISGMHTVLMLSRCVRDLLVNPPAIAKVSSETLTSFLMK